MTGAKSLVVGSRPEQREDYNATLAALMTRIQHPMLSGIDYPEWEIENLEADIAVVVGALEYRRLHGTPSYRKVGSNHAWGGEWLVPKYLRTMEAATTLSLPDWSQSVYLYPNRVVAVLQDSTKAADRRDIVQKATTAEVATTLAWLRARMVPV